MAEDKRALVWERITEFIAAKTYCTVSLALSDNPERQGIILKATHEWVQILSSFDVQPDGVAFLKIQHIDKVRPFSKFVQKVMRNDDMRALVSGEPLADMQSTAALLRWLAKRPEYITIEFSEKDNEIFYIGKPLRVSSKSLSFFGFDTNGKWWKTPRKVAMSDISIITYKSPYAEFYRKHMTAALSPERKLK